MMDFIEQYVNLRFRRWTNRIDLFIIYEAFPEEGEGVSKKLKVFDNQPECDEWLEHHKRAYQKWLRTFMVTSATTPVASPPSALTTSSALRRTKSKPIQASDTGSTQPSTESTQTQLSSFETLPSQSVAASNIAVGDRIIGQGVVASTKRQRKSVVFTFKEHNANYVAEVLQILEIQRGS